MASCAEVRGARVWTSLSFLSLHNPFCHVCTAKRKTPNPSQDGFLSIFKMIASHPPYHSDFERGCSEQLYILVMRSDSIFPKECGPRDSLSNILVVKLQFLQNAFACTNMNWKMTMLLFACGHLSIALSALMVGSVKWMKFTFLSDYTWMITCDN